MPHGMSPAEAAPFALWRAAWLGLATLLAALLATVHLGTTFQYIPLASLLEFSAPDPFQRRVLMPALAAALGALVDAPTVVRGLLLGIAAWGALIGSAWWVLGSVAPPLGTGARRWIALTVVVPVGSQLMLPARFRAFNGDAVVGDVHGLLQPFTRIQALPGLYFPYDVPAAALLLAGLAALGSLAARPDRRRWTTYAVVYVAAALNRETAVLLVPLTLWTLRARLAPSALVALGLAQVLAVVALVIAVGAIVDAVPNPRSAHAGGLEWYLWTNLRTLAHPLYAVPALVPLAGGAWLPPLLRWRALPSPARALVVLYVLPAFAVALTFGILLETRVFTEVAAALWLAAVLALLAPAGRRV